MDPGHCYSYVETWATAARVAQQVNSALRAAQSKTSAHCQVIGSEDGHENVVDSDLQAAYADAVAKYLYGTDGEAFKEESDSDGEGAGQNEDDTPQPMSIAWAGDSQQLGQKLAHGVNEDDRMEPMSIAWAELSQPREQMLAIGKEEAADFSPAFVEFVPTGAAHVTASSLKSLEFGAFEETSFSWKPDELPTRATRGRTRLLKLSELTADEAPLSPTFVEFVPDGSVHVTAKALKSLEQRAFEEASLPRKSDDLPAQGRGRLLPLSGMAVAESLVKENVSTVMLRNLPHTVTQQRLLRELEETGFKGSYDFLYAPSSFTTGRGNGYAFVNFVSSAAVAAFATKWHGSRRFAMSPDDPPVTVSKAKVQGREQNEKRWSKQRMRRVKNPALRALLLHQGEV